MAVYAIYKIIFEKTDQKALYMKDDGTTAIERANELLGSLMSEGSVRVFKNGKDGESIPLECDVERKHEDVMALSVYNEKKVKYYRKRDEQTQVSTPGCNVIVWNKPQVGLIAIERSPSFDSKPDRVRDILQSSFNCTLEQDYGIRVTFRAKMHAGEFWDLIREHHVTLGDKVKKVEFKFGQLDEEEANLSYDAPQTALERLKWMQRVAVITQAVKGALTMEAKKDGTLYLDQAQEDIAQMVNLCCDNGYSIAVHFRLYGVYRYGEQTKALIQMKDEMWEEFKNGQTSTGFKTDRGKFAIMQWLENVRHITEAYSDEEPVTKKRKSSHQD